MILRPQVVRRDGWCHTNFLQSIAYSRHARESGVIYVTLSPTQRVRSRFYSRDTPYGSVIYITSGRGGAGRGATTGGAGLFPGLRNDTVTRPGGAIALPRSYGPVPRALL